MFTVCFLLINKTIQLDQINIFGSHSNVTIRQTSKHIQCWLVMSIISIISVHKGLTKLTREPLNTC